MPNDKEAATYEKNTKEQYEALGRFVEAFEAMVNEARFACIQLLTRGSEHQRLLFIPFYNQSLTAKPLFDIMRAIMIEIVNDEASREANKITKTDQSAFKDILRTIATEYEDLCKKRNDLLHGTWFIGYKSADDPDASEFLVQRFAATKDGLVPKKLEKNAKELHSLIQRCERARDWIGLVQACLGFSGTGFKINEVFKQQGAQWCRLVNGRLEPLKQSPTETKS